MLIKPAEEVSYAAILKNLKSRFNLVELGATVRGVRETRSKDLLVEVNCAAKDRGRLDSVFRDIVRSAHHLVPIVEVKITDIDPTTEAEEIEEALRICLDEDLKTELKVTMAKRP